MVARGAMPDPHVNLIRRRRIQVAGILLFKCGIFELAGAGQIPPLMPIARLSGAALPGGGAICRIAG